MTGHENDRAATSTEIAIVAFAIVLAAVIWFCGCPAQGVKSTNDIAASMKTSLKNQQDMADRIESLSGTLTKIQTTISTIENTITTTIKQNFETFSGSQRLAFENFAGEMKTINKTSTNTTAYGIGLVATVLVFVLAVIWLLARILRGIAGRLLK